MLHCHLPSWIMRQIQILFSCMQYKKCLIDNDFYIEVIAYWITNSIKLNKV